MKNKNTSLKTGAVLEREREREREREQLNNKKMKTKKLFLAAAILILNSTFLILDCSAQNIGINSTGATPNASAALDIDINQKGLLIPRMSTADRNLITSPVNSLMIYNTTDNCLQIYGSGSSTWQNIYCICTAAPATPGSITGTTSMCANSTGISYSIAAVTGATSYTWAAPAGSTITSGQGTTNILVNFGASSGNISVTATNSCGTSAASSLAITITASPTTANAGPDQNLTCNATSTTLAGNAPGVGTGLWTLISGTATITTPSSPTSTLTGISGNVVLRWAISNSPCSASTDDVSIFPNSCVTDDNFTVLKLHMDGSNGSTTFIDNSPVTPHAVTANGSAQISTAQAKFCQSSLFDGTGDYLSVPDDADWDFGSGDFTIDAWVNTADLSGTRGIVGQYQDLTNDAYYLKVLTDGSLGAQIFLGNVAIISLVSTAGQITINNWYHLALVRNGNDWNIYKNGVSVANISDGDAVPNYTGMLTVGAHYDGSQSLFFGNIDELRISKGVARWTSNFTPPASPYCD